MRVNQAAVEQKNKVKYSHPSNTFSSVKKAISSASVVVPFNLNTGK